MTTTPGWPQSPRSDSAQPAWRRTAEQSTSRKEEQEREREQEEQPPGASEPVRLSQARMQQGSCEGPTDKALSGLSLIQTCHHTVASESWDEDFLWQHSSCSDLHLPSSNRARERARDAERDRHRSSTSTRSSSTHTSALSLSYGPGSSSSAQRAGKSSTVSNMSHGSSWGYASTLSLAEGVDEDQDPTITLASRISPARTASGVPLQRAYTSPVKTIQQRQQQYTANHRYSQQNRPVPVAIPEAGRNSSRNRHPATLSIATRSTSDTSSRRPVSSPSPSPSPSFFSNSWRSTTPSLTSDLGHLTSSTETDNETEHELGQSKWDEDDDDEQEDGLPHDRKASTGSSTPRIGLAGLFGSTGRLRQKGKEILSGSTLPFAGMARRNSVKRQPQQNQARGSNLDRSFSSSSSASASGTSSIFGRRPSLKHATSSTSTTPSLSGSLSSSLFGRSLPSSLAGTSPAFDHSSQMGSSVPESDGATPTILTLKEHRTIRARQGSANALSISFADDHRRSTRDEHVRDREAEARAPQQAAPPLVLLGRNTETEQEQEEGDCFSGIDDLTDEDEGTRHGDEPAADGLRYARPDPDQLRSSGLQGILQRPLPTDFDPNASTTSLLSTTSGFSTSTTAPSVSFSSATKGDSPSKGSRRGFGTTRRITPTGTLRGRSTSSDGSLMLEAHGEEAAAQLISGFSFPGPAVPPTRQLAPPSPSRSVDSASSTKDSPTKRRRSFGFPAAGGSRRSSVSGQGGSGGAPGDSSADEADSEWQPSVRAGSHLRQPDRRSKGKEKEKERMAFANDSDSERTVPDEGLSDRPGADTANANSAGGWFFSKAGGGIKRLSRMQDPRISKLPFPSPDRKKSNALLRTATRESTVAGYDPADAASQTSDARKSRRPLSLTAMLSRTSLHSLANAETVSGSKDSNDMPDGRGRLRSGTVTSASYIGASKDRKTRSANPSPISPNFPDAGIAESVPALSAAGRKKFLHRSTASSGNVPTAKSLLGTLGELGPSD